MEGLFHHDEPVRWSLIAESQDDETAAQAALTLAKSGNVTTETLRAFTLDEFRDIVEATS